MFEKVVKKLNGSGGDPNAIGAALMQLGRDREEARAKIDELNKRRHQALLDDASDADIDAIEREIDRTTVRLEKLTVAEPPLLDKLASAKTAVRARRWQSHRETWLAAAAEFVASARATAAKHTALIAIVGQARAEGFEHEARFTMAETPNIAGNALCAADLIDLFERAVSGYSANIPKAPVAPAHPVARQFLPHERRPATDAARSVSLALSDRATPKQPRAPDDVDPLELGEARVKVMRAGYSPAEDRPQCAYGQIVRMSVGAAERAANAGAVEILETCAETPAAASTASQESARNV